jgi:starch phosphorylase
MPPALAPLKELAYNYWWCWHNDAIELFRRIDTSLWEEVHHNPVALLARLSHKRLEQLAERVEFVNSLAEVYEKFKAYMEGNGWWSDRQQHPGYIAYFCAEFGIHESFSSYSGGLGVLAGDHLKSASDMGLPLVGVGLLYQEGYFRQYLTQNGWQNEQYLEVDFYSLPLTMVTKPDGTPLTISVDMPLGKCHAQIWRLNVGRVPLYLLDTNTPLNELDLLRDLTDRLYGGTTDTRIAQELMLGIGGMRALEALGIEPSTVHINEGHAAFALLERTRSFMQKHQLSFEEALRITQSTSVFTTHTPVPAGNEVFYHDVLQPYFEAGMADLGLTWNQFIMLGAQADPKNEEGFSMTVLGLHCAAYRNGVSKLHGNVARTMWHKVWSDFPVNEVPISAITNGVHAETWVASELGELYDRYLGPQWRTKPHLEESWSSVDAIPNMELWRVHQRRREQLVIGAREHILSKHSASLTQEQASRIHECLDPDVLTIGFARRFASYKRADLIMRDMDRLTKILSNEDRPVQIVMAGKSHPRDGEGKNLIQGVHLKIKEHGLEHRVVFLEDYDMNVARLMVRGCDVWLNTPRKPYEASGTSGMKAVLNGVIHCSILDGWWAEAYDGENGFAIGRGEVFDPSEQDDADAATLYDVIEHGIVASFYDIGKSRIPERWLALMKYSIRTNAWRFSAIRMVNDYANNAYQFAIETYQTMIADSGKAAREVVAFFTRIESAWPQVSIADVTAHGTSGAYVGKNIQVSASIHLGELSPADVIVQAVYGKVDSKGEINPASTTEMKQLEIKDGTSFYNGEYTCLESGVQGCTVRVMPRHSTLVNLADSHKVVYATN